VRMPAIQWGRLASCLARFQPTPAHGNLHCDCNALLGGCAGLAVGGGSLGIRVCASTMVKSPPESDLSDI